ncbi:phosphotransferase family protein [Streptomyces sp. NBC_01314]|uniref:phosphotransferase family protein n=1 Tax=Streptomyces sp. NBC_01314 TaxID=2903821 RepID=UPI00308CE8F6|nr:aminoglycoside phosphotransferase family protein [Streptomyces sp. NBC_01314]
MRTGRLLGSGRTADVYELHTDESESATAGPATLVAHSEATAPDGLDDGDGADGHTGRGGRPGRNGLTGPAAADGHHTVDGPNGHFAADGAGGSGRGDALGWAEGPSGDGGPGNRDAASGPGGPGDRGEVGGRGGRRGLGGRAATGRTGSPEGAVGAWVLRRYRDGWGDAAAEAEIMEHVRAHGYPVPRVRSASRTEMVLERLSGPTMLEAVATGLLDPAQVGATLARLLHSLHALPPRNQALCTPRGQDISPPRDQDISLPGSQDISPPRSHTPGHSLSPTAAAPPPTRGASSTAPTPRVLHLDLHPENVILTTHGPRVIDWSTAEEGPPGLDWGTSAVILAQVAVDTADFRAEMAHATLVSLLLAQQPDGPSALTEEGLVEAGRRRAANPTMTAREVELVGAAEELIRSLMLPATVA